MSFELRETTIHGHLPVLAGRHALNAGRAGRVAAR